MKKIFYNYSHIIIPSIITLLFVLLCPLYYNIVDDVTLETMAQSVATNNNSEFLVYISVVIEWMLKGMYTLIPIVNWNIILYLIILTLSFISLHSIAKDYGVFNVSTYVLIIMQLYLLADITYTMYAIMAVCAGIMLMLHYVKKLDKGSLKYIIAAFLMIFMGFALRKGEVFILMILLFIPFIAFLVIEKRNTLLSVIMLYILMFGASAILDFAENMYIENVLPKDSYYVEFSKYRSKLTDEGYNNYTKNEEYFKKNDITENDLRLSSQFIYGDKKFFSQERCAKIVNAKGMDEKYIQNPFLIAKRMSPLPFIWIYTAMALLLFVALKGERKKIFCISVFVLGAILYLFVRQRGIPRVVNPIALCGIVMLIYVLAENLNKDYRICRLISNIKFSKWASAAVLLFAIIFGLYSWHNHYAHTKVIQETETVREYMKENPENIYVRTPPQGGFTDYRADLTVDENQMVYSVVGDWMIYTPYWYDMIKNCGLSEYADSSLCSLLDDNVMIVSHSHVNGLKHMNWLIKFLDEHYDRKVELIKICDGGEYAIYKMTELKDR